MKPSIHSLKVMARSQDGIVKTERQFDVVTADLRNIFPMKLTACSQYLYKKFSKDGDALPRENR